MLRRSFFSMFQIPFIGLLKLAPQVSETMQFGDELITILKKDGNSIIAWTKESKSKKVKRWWCRDQLHRTDGPAIEYANGDKHWYQHDKLHRIDGPAVEYTNGVKFWYQNGERHRIDGPAIEHANGDKYWYQHGELHRTDGPAIEYANGDKYWYQNGKSRKSHKTDVM